MIRRFTVTNFQSLRDVDLPLGPLTVIVGPSNSGKSALIRAMRALASNVRGSDVVTRGAKTMRITAQTDGHEVTLTRTGTTGAYQIRELSADGEPDSYTKLAGGVPAAVTRALRIDPVPAGGASLSVAGQLDPPYLLGDSGATVARVLGELTNVDVILAAVREANRRRGEDAGRLRTRQADLADLRERARGYAELPARLAACARAEAAAEAAAGLDDRAARLRRAATTLQVAQDVLNRVSVPAVPTDAALTQALHRLTAFRRIVTGWINAANAGTAAHTAAASWAEREAALHEELHAALVAAGQCPTCGQPVT